jgi:hypothetical protein
MQDTCLQMFPLVLQKVCVAATAGIFTLSQNGYGAKCCEPNEKTKFYCRPTGGGGGALMMVQFHIMGQQENGAVGDGTLGRLIVEQTETTF